MRQIIVGVAELAVVHNPAVLVTIGLGSCVGISFHDPVAKIGALAHVVLPSIERSKYKENPLKFADSAIETAVKIMLQKGCSRNRIKSKIAGGASMFSFRDGMNIGEKNVEAVMRKLNEMKIPVLASDTGGNYGRTLEFHVETGVMVVKSAFRGTKEI
ncbi:chemotaxis protein [Candidatus Methanoperedens nitroreducens]|uniref:Probable chemoreceptor glutamine deamidase CheD n=1 Tax=Candidatus Methanoperedens nitratireducens TaxID=1392998 RepID=A0A062V6U3_9EURY|nr:chemotaxis protein CheD [Candidatus Methanoperedens nitroreducens]KCZ71125.1 chemotaxis protein [Candidatus Methanoperedens nitroreducens]MDJ1421497.1 chemotaxis protein CheD [Candidatus Methanoperedens sp.]